MAYNDPFDVDMSMHNLEEPEKRKSDFSETDSENQDSSLFDEISQQDIGSVPFTKVDAELPFEEPGGVGGRTRLNDTSQERTKRRAALDRAKIESTAKGLGFLFENMMALSCSAIDRTGNYKKYKLDRDDKETMLQAFEDYVEARQIHLSPEFTLFSVLALTSVPRIIEANNYKKERQKVERTKQYMRTRKGGGSDGESTGEMKEETTFVGNEEIVEAFVKKDYSNLREFEERRQYYQLVPDGHYRFHPTIRDYVKVDERAKVGKPSAEVRAWIEQGLDNKQIQEIIFGK